MADWDNRHMSLAVAVAKIYSKDPSKQVGAVVVDRDNRIAGIGYNGFPRHVHDTQERLRDVDTKNALTIHAETNAVLNAGRTRGCTLYSTFFPCLDCAKIIIQAGIACVVTPKIHAASDWYAQQVRAASVFAEAGVKVRYYDE